MILEVTHALVDVIHTATPEIGDWVELHSLSAADGPLTDAKAQLALISVEPHPHMLNRPLVEGIAGLVRAPLHLGSGISSRMRGIPTKRRLASRASFRRSTPLPS